MALNAAVDADAIVVPSRLFGPVTVSDSQIIVFEDGLKGFASQHRFVLLPTDTEGLFWLQSADEGNLAFLVIDPFTFLPDYEVPMPPEGLGPFSSDEYPDLIVLSILRLPQVEGLHPTANLAAPLLVNPFTQVGIQITDVQDYSPHYALTLPAGS